MQSWKGLQKIELQFIYVNEKGKKSLLFSDLNIKSGKKLLFSDLNTEFVSSLWS